MLSVSAFLYVGLSLAAIVVALVTMAAIYRSARPSIGDPVIVSVEEIDTPVLSVSRRHLGLEHLGKAPVVSFFVAGQRKALLKRPLKIVIESGDGKYTYGPREGALAAGGGVCVDRRTAAALDEKLRKLGLERKVTSISLTMHYPSALNLAFLLKDHPDMAVRTGAWIFVLTGIFAIVQTVLGIVLGV